MWEETQLNIENQMTALITPKFTHRKKGINEFRRYTVFIHINTFCIYV